MAGSKVNPKTVGCPLCGAKKDEGCVRVSEGYGEGNLLRRQHTARFRAADERAQATRRVMRRAG